MHSTEAWSKIFTSTDFRQTDKGEWSGGAGRAVNAICICITWPVPRAVSYPEVERFVVCHDGEISFAGVRSSRSGGPRCHTFLLRASDAVDLTEPILQHVCPPVAQLRDSCTAAGRFGADFPETTSASLVAPSGPSTSPRGSGSLARRSRHGMSPQAAVTEHLQDASTHTETQTHTFRDGLTCGRRCETRGPGGRRVEEAGKCVAGGQKRGGGRLASHRGADRWPALTVRDPHQARCGDEQTSSTRQDVT